MLDDINDSLKDENIEITASALTHPDDEDEVDEVAGEETEAELTEDEFGEDDDDELDADKMDFEPEEKDLL